MKTSNTLVATILVAGLLDASPARATDFPRQMWDTAGSACQLSVPTISSEVRPRATGMRNEGTVNEFVICQYATTSAPYATAGLYISSIDGANHTVKCTAVTSGYDPNARPFLYSTKQIDTGAGLGVIWQTPMTWTPLDLGLHGESFYELFSVTCILPAGAAITSLNGFYNEYIGP